MKVAMSSKTRITDKALAIGRRIADARRNSGLSQAALATKLGLTSGAISQWETGRAVPEPDKFQMLAETLGVETGWLLTGDEPDELARAQTTNELSALEIFRKMRPAEQAKALQVLEALASTPDNPRRKGIPGAKINVKSE